MFLPRLTKSIFTDQLLYMQLAGVLIGLAFPHVLVMYGFAAEQVLTLNFYIVSQIAGQIVGLISFVLIAMVVRPHLRELSSKMSQMADGINAKGDWDYTKNCSDDLCKMHVSSADEVGVSAKAYNDLLMALLDSHEAELVYTQLSEVTSDNLDPQYLSKEIIELLIKSSKVDAAAILIAQKGAVRLEYEQGIYQADSLLVHDAVLEVFKSGQPHYLKMPKFIEMDAVLTRFPPAEVFINPIEFKGTVLGVMVAATCSELADERTHNTLKLFTRSMGLALNNALIHSKFQRLAAYDALTNVYNRRFGLSHLKEDFSRAVRDQTALSVIMIDIDHFKAVNDTYGHLVGDKIITIIASILKNASREGDIVVRYGGEEFLMILPGASVKNAAGLAERIRHQVKDTICKEGDQQIILTVSLGVSGYLENQPGDEVALIDQADQALYNAKHSGRNQVVNYGQF